MTTVRELIDQNAASQPDKAFLIAPESGTQMTYAQLRDHAHEITAALDALGIAKGEKVAFLLPNGYWTTALLLGVMYSGRVIVPLNAVSGDAALSYVIEHSDTRAILVNEELANKFSGVLAQVPGGILSIATDVDQGVQWPVSGNEQPDLSALATDDDAILMYTCLLYTSDAADE